MTFNNRMENLKLFWHNHTPAGKWALAWLAAHLAVIGLIALLVPGNTQALQRLAISALAVGLAYLLARRGQEVVAAVGLGTILTLDFHLSVLVNYAAGISGYDLLVIVSLSVVVMAEKLLGRRGLVAFAASGTLILVVGQTLFEPDYYMSTIAYLAATIAIFLFFERREQTQDRGIIHRFAERDGHVEIQLDTRQRGRLRVHVARGYFQQLGLQRGDYITIERGENRAADKSQYIQALSIRKINNQS